MAKRPVPKYDFKAFGAAIKAAREGRKESRKKVGDEMFIDNILQADRQPEREKGMEHWLSKKWFSYRNRKRYVV